MNPANVPILLVNLTSGTSLKRNDLCYQLSFLYLPYMQFRKLKYKLKFRRLLHRLQITVFKNSPLTYKKRIARWLQKRQELFKPQTNRELITSYLQELQRPNQDLKEPEIQRITTLGVSDAPDNLPVNTLLPLVTEQGPWPQRLDITGLTGSSKLREGWRTFPNGIYRATRKDGKLQLEKLWRN